MSFVGANGRKQLAVISVRLININSSFDGVVHCDLVNYFNSFVKISTCRIESHILLQTTRNDPM